MQIRPLTIAGAFEVTPRQFPDDRGVFLESFRGDLLAAHVGHRLDVVQTNVSVSARGTLRGIHFADVPIGQAKYVTAVTGSLIDYVAEGLGHAFLALEDGTTAHYLCGAAYDPGAEHGIDPLDPEVALPLPDGIDVRLSPKDAAAPSLAAATERGMLPTWAACTDWYERLASD